MMAAIRMKSLPPPAELVDRWIATRDAMSAHAENSRILIQFFEFQKAHNTIGIITNTFLILLFDPSRMPPKKNM
jgi:hypothetical protein